MTRLGQPDEQNSVLDFLWWLLADRSQAQLLISDLLDGYNIAGLIGTRFLEIMALPTEKLEAGNAEPLMAACRRFITVQDGKLFLRDLIKTLLEQKLAASRQQLITATTSATKAIRALKLDAGYEETHANLSMLISDMVTLRRNIDNISAALERIGDDTWQTCAKCGGEISLTRLCINPVTTVCSNVNCRRQVPGGGA